MQRKNKTIPVVFAALSLTSLGNAFGQNTFPATGNVGIGTSTPAAQVNIGSKADATVSSLKFGVAGDKGILAVPLGASAGGYNIDFAGWRDISTNFIGARIRGERINIFQANNALSQGMDLAFFTGASGGSFVSMTERLRIRYDGNVGIGTSTPRERLSVNGTIRSQEVKVEATNWPDYVFHRDYRLPSPDSLSAAIGRLGHLPGMPSASEVRENGVSLGEMNRKLLEKVEELTLMLIEQDRKLESQGKEIRELKKAVSAGTRTGR